MSLRNRWPQLHILVAIPVALIIVAAFAVSVAAVMENLRFINATNQTLDLVSQVRSLASAQKSFATNAGEDIWAGLASAGQTPPNMFHLNPWQGQIRATTALPMAMRVETDLPSHDCRRMILYFLDREPVELGLLSMEAQAVGDAGWKNVYAPPGTVRRGAEMACGDAPWSRLALIFKVR